MSTEANKALVRRYNDEVWSQGNLAVVEETIGDDLLWGADHVTPEGVKPRIQRPSRGLAFEAH